MDGLVEGAFECPDRLDLYTIGHSNHPADRFVDLLCALHLEVVVDVRSSPDSAFLPYFGRSPLTRLLREAGIKYIFLGVELGGRPSGDEYYDADGHVLYGAWARSPPFLEGLRRLVSGCTRYRVAVMCSEEDPTDCHRRLLVASALSQHSHLPLHHIRTDGAVETED